MDHAWSRRRLLASVGTAITVAGAGCTFREEPSASSPTPVEDPDYDLAVDHPPLEEWADYDPDWKPPSGSPLAVDVEIQVLVEHLEIPWDLSVTGTGEIIITERPGRISRYDTDELDVITEPADVIDHADVIDVDEEDVGWFAAGSEGGLLGCAAHPNYPDVPVVYAFYTYESGRDTRNRLVYYDLSGTSPEETIVIDDIPGNEIAHNGARLAFGPRNYLWVTMGDAEPDVDEYDPDPSTLAGTVFRVRPDGDVPEDNPAIPDADPRIYSLGHRNPQGIDWLPDGTAIVTEHGPVARDEIQLLRPGDDHGWPTVRGTPDDEEYDAYAGNDDVAPPLVTTGTESTWAPSGAVFYRGEELPAWRNRFLVGGLRSQQLNVVTPYRVDEEPPTADGGQHHDADWSDPEYHAVSHTTLTDELGRIRHLDQGPDGALYAITSNRDGRASGAFPVAGDDKLVRIRTV